MKKETLKDMVEQGFSIRKISTQTGKSQTTIRYWLKKYELKTSFKKPTSNPWSCAKCQRKGLTQEDFYTRKNRPRPTYSYCKECANKSKVDRQRIFKKKCVDYKGGECKICGYDKCIDALDFHHVNPSKKNRSIVSMRSLGKKWDESVKTELDKCVLVCARCHREIHAGLHPEYLSNS
jgi:transposase-like protein